MIQTIEFRGGCPDCKSDVVLYFTRTDYVEPETNYKDYDYSQARCPKCSSNISYEDVEQYFSDKPERKRVKRDNNRTGIRNNQLSNMQ